VVLFHCRTKPSLNLTEVDSEQRFARAGSLFVRHVTIRRKVCYCRAITYPLLGFMNQGSGPVQLERGLLSHCCGCRVRPTNMWSLGVMTIEDGEKFNLTVFSKGDS
jgi:hypothetical protein